MKKLFVTIVALAVFIPALANAAKVLKPANNSTMMPVGGADATGNAQILRVDPDGSIYVNAGPAPGATFYNGLVEITAAGATDRVQLPNLDVRNCTFQALSDNSSSLYIGGSTVTNKAGVNRGFELPQSMPFNNVSVTNLNVIYIAGDSVGDKLSYGCN